ncbi:universal stress protein [Variovorax sp. J22R133]|uniref:universal stress protein n=1 Tax=Variovorax brevis TaxID=3053503 RepID=UPI00257515EF|nr:universal stress protein [Variovorax sp. J22R133]MDM0116330.1 universal stress protein [Variovorax sp. J22R133]
MYQRILVPIDGSSTSRQGLDEALRLARLSGGSVRLVHIVDQLKYVTGFETFSAYDSDLLPIMEEAGEQILQEGREIAKAAGIQAETLLFTSLADRVCDVVIEQAKVWKADLIVIGTHGRHGVGRLLLGSDAEQILRLSPVPVLLVRAPQADAGAASAAAGVPERVTVLI